MGSRRGCSRSRTAKFTEVAWCAGHHKGVPLGGFAVQRKGLTREGGGSLLPCKDHNGDLRVARQRGPFHPARAGGGFRWAEGRGHGQPSGTPRRPRDVRVCVSWCRVPCAAGSPKPRIEFTVDVWNASGKLELIDLHKRRAFVSSGFWVVYACKCYSIL